MSNHRASSSDREFVEKFESCDISETDFDHKAHIRLAYAYLCDHDANETSDRMRIALRRFLRHLGIAPKTKYHETMTQAWVGIVQRSMEELPESSSAEEFMDAFPELGKAETLMNFYSKALIHSDEARTSFVQPDLSPLSA